MFAPRCARSNQSLLESRDGKPVLASSSMGSGLHPKTIQCLIDMLDFSMNPKQAVDAPYLMFPAYGSGGRQTQRVETAAFSSALFERARQLGLAIEEIENSRDSQGLWVGIRIDLQSGCLEAASPGVTNGAALAY